MGDIKKIYGVDKEAEISGVWHDMGDGVRVKIARIGNPQYQKEFQRISKPYRNSIRRRSLSDEVAERLLIDAMAKCIVLDWDGLEEDGVPIPYSVANAKRLLTEYRDFRDNINDFANEMEGFRQEEVEEGEKN